MKHFLTLAGIVLAGTMAMTSCSKNYKKTDNGIVVTTTDKQKVRLQVVSPTIIRVTATVEDEFSKKESLVVLPQEKCDDWNVSEDNGFVTVSTAFVSASVNEKTGIVTFKDMDGNVLLQESDKGKSFQHVDEFPWMEHGNQEQHEHCVAKDCKDSYYRVCDQFESPDDEAFYGLGGHQHGFMNYKGKDVELAQHNMVPCVPFLYSNKGYGILWDNYSITRFGDPREYQPISDLKLYDKNGNEGGLTATYTVPNGPTETITIKEQVESNIDYAFLASDGSRSNIADFDISGVSGVFPYTTFLETFPYATITWEGQIASDEAGLHKFLLYASGYFKLWIDGELIMDKWRQNWNPWSNPFTVDMKANEKHDFKLEWKTEGGFLGLTHLSPYPDQNKLTLSSEAADEIDYYFVYGENPKDYRTRIEDQFLTPADRVVSGYRQLTGKAPIVPKWAMGFWQSRQRYQTADEILSTVKTFRDKHIPLDNIVLDWHYWPTDGWGTQTFDSVRFADPKAMVDSLHNAYNAHIMISVWPKFYAHTDNYKKMNEKGYILTHNVDMNRLDWVWPGFKNGWYDVYNPGARDMFWDMVKGIYDLGFDAWWLDATEPDMHSNISVADRKCDLTPNAMGNGERMFNPYATYQAKGIYENQRKETDQKRVFILTRSAFAGLQRYGAANWSGDIVARWSDLKDQIGHGVNFSLSGIPYWTMDIGGFSVESRYSSKPKYTPEDIENQKEWKELQTRWYQFGAFCPLFRSHGEYPYREIFNIANENEEAYQSILNYMKLRYRLMPYIYSLAGQAYHSDYTIMRGLVMDFFDDANVLNINDQYMFGPSFLVCPVSEYKARSRKVYLPKCEGWYRLNAFSIGKCGDWAGDFYEGGQEIDVNAPLMFMPVFVKAGSIIPKGKQMEYTDQYPDDELFIDVYSGANGSFELYSDEGTNYNYEKGEYSIIPMFYDDEAKTLTLLDRRGSYKGMPESVKITVRYIPKELTQRTYCTATYTGQELVLKLNERKDEDVIKME